MVEALARIDGGHTSALALRVFELALLDAVGLAPSFDRCVGCGDPPLDDDRQLLDVRRGGVMCGHCGAAVGGPLSPSVRGALLSAQRAGGTELDRWSTLSADDGAHARDALQALLAEHLRRPLRSVEFIAKLNASSHG